MPKKRQFGQISTLPSGRIRARYPDPDGQLADGGRPFLHNAPHTFDTTGEAEGWLAAERQWITTGYPPERYAKEGFTGPWIAPAERGATKRAKKVTLGEYANAWLPARKVKGRPLSGKTRDEYRRLLDDFILPTFEDVPLAAITAQAVDHWYDICAIGRPTTQARAYGLLRTILGTAAERDLIPFNPCKVRGGGSVTRRHDPRPATLEQLAVIAKAVPDRRQMMIQLAAWCSLRFGELAELRRKDIDLSSNVIRVRRGVTSVAPPHTNLPPGQKPCGCAPKCVVGPPKTAAGVRDVPIPPHIVEDLERHLNDHTAPGRESLLFPGPDGRHLTSSAFYGRASEVHTSGEKKGQIRRNGHGYFEARRLAGRDDLHFHDLRHTGLTNAAESGATLKQLMHLAGHTTPAAAMRYQHAVDESLQQLAQRMSAKAESGTQ